MGRIMNPDFAAELAGRLNPKICKIDRTPTGKPIYSAEDISGAIGLIKIERYRLWIHVAYAHHLQFYQSLHREILTDIVNKYAHEKWDNRPGMLSKLIQTSVLETLQTPVCMTCNGQKSILVDSRPVICDSCKGSGTDRKSDYWRASMCEIHRELWKRHWKSRYENVLDIVRGIDYGAKQALCHRLTL